MFLQMINSANIALVFFYDFNIRAKERILL
jgi:hypothetical protein